ncbi:MAG TPA: helix-turn-helix transcriptional regulator [Pseudonocardia sp.]
MTDHRPEALAGPKEAAAAPRGRVRRLRDVDGGKLRAVRVSTGTHMRALAEAAGCSWRHLQMIETSGRQPSEELLNRFAIELTRLSGRPISVDEFSYPLDTRRAA